MRTGISWLDVKLSFRMLVKYPGLTLVGGAAMAFAIWVGAVGFEVYTQVIRPTLPLDAGERIVGIHTWNLATGSQEDPVLRDFATWREELESVEDLGAFRTLERNLIAGEGESGPVAGAEISASAFRVARVPQLLGRTLVEADEQPGADPVVVIGHDLWQTRFGGDPGIIGRDVRLGNSVHTVVGVMPEGFAFPVSQNLWVPLRLRALDYEGGQQPEVRVFGRLAPGATLREAQAELSAIGLRAAADFRDPHEHLRPRVLPYAKSLFDPSGELSVGLLGINAFLVMLLVLVCGNVALLMFARAAARESDIVVRSALGASRSRIVGQFFLEALVLGAVAATVGLAAAAFGLRAVMEVYQAEAGGRLPFWLHASLSPATVFYACVLTLLGAGIAGVMPALKVTRGLRTRLQQSSAGGGGFRFGGVWTGVIVAQVAVTLVFPVTTFFAQRQVERFHSADVGFPSEEYLSVRIEIDRETLPGDGGAAERPELRAAFATRLQELERRLEADPAVVGVTFADRLPRTYHPPRRIEVEDGGAVRSAPDAVVEVGSASVAPDYFDVLHAPVVSGRGFHSADVESGRGVVIVNRSFVERVLGGQNPIGLRVRYASPAGREPGPWQEIVGVVRDLGMINHSTDAAGLYHPLGQGVAHPVHMAVQVRGDPQSVAPRLLNLAAAVDPALRLQEIMPLDRAGFRAWSEMAFIFRVAILISALALILALAGIYSIMAFTVSQRTREIGIRVALGAETRHVVAATFRRPLGQVGVGILLGSGVATLLLFAYYGGVLSVSQVGLLAAYTGLMVSVCLLACVVPTRRALRVQPTEALKADA